MPPKPDVSVERKEQIFQAALACLVRKGYHLTTMDDIVAESGLSKGALYWYFDSKKALFLALFQELLAQTTEEWVAIAGQEEGSAADKLRASLALFRTMFQQFLPFFGVMMEAWALTRHDADVKEVMESFYQPYIKIMLQIIEEGQATGEFTLRHARATTLVILTLFDGIALALSAGIWEHDWNEVMAAAEQLVLKGLGVEDAG